MSVGSDNCIAGSKKPADWYSLRKRLTAHNDAPWGEAFQDSFVKRLRLRYLDPIDLIQKSLKLRGEGFSIVAVQCTLVEFLEATRQGKSYHRRERGYTLGHYEYSSSSEIFTTFLSKRHPFCNTFDKASAKDFYVNVRCALLHEARTKTWRIKAKGPKGLVANVDGKEVFRNNFQDAICEYINAYGAELLSDRDLQDAFIRKFNSLCV